MDEVEETTHEVVNSEQPEVAPQESTESAKEDQSHEDRNERNWRRANEAIKRREQEIRQQREEIAELRKMVESKNQQPEVDELDTIQADEFIPKGKIDKLWEKRERRLREETKKEIEEAFLMKEKLRWKDRLKEKYSDFDDVVNVETLSLLEERDPEIAETIAELKDPYKVGIQSYKYIKALGLTNSLGSDKRKKEVEKKLTENEKTLQSPQVYDKRPLAQAYRITDADRKALYKEMMEAAGAGGFSY